MKKLIYITIALALFVGLFLLVSKPAGHEGESPDARTTTETEQSQALSYDSVAQEVAAGTAVLYDVRTAEEFASGHAPVAENYPLQLLEAGQFPTDQKDKTLYLYCNSGNRSGQATVILQDEGYSVVDLGGLDDIEAIGATLVQ